MQIAPPNRIETATDGDAVRAELARLDRIETLGVGNPSRPMLRIAELIGSAAAALVLAQSRKLKEEGSGPICDIQIEMLIWAASDPALQVLPAL